MDTQLAPAPHGRASSLQARVRGSFREWLSEVGPGPIVILAHHDADGLSAGALLARALRSSEREAEVRIVGRGESPWSPQMQAELSARAPAGVIAADLGVRPGRLLEDAPSLLIDHHVPQGAHPDVTVISGHGEAPIPTSSLLAYWCAGALIDPQPLLWLAALGLIGDMAEGSGFAELAEARARYRIGVLRDAVALINAPRRTASGDATPALSLLMTADGPEQIVSGVSPDSAALAAAREEVKCEMAVVRKVAPKIKGEVALIRFHSPCQLHPLIAQQWRGRLKGQIVMAANTGYRPGWVHFAIRSARNIDLIAFLAEHAPPGADENYGSGHRAATGGALRAPDWNTFISGLGFGPEEHVAP